MLMVSLRKARSLAGSKAPTSLPSMTMEPLVVSMSRLSMRMIVDLPEPDRPMMTKISPRLTSKETSSTALKPVMPLLLRDSRDRDLVG
jgi:hypothetical protein